MEARGVGAKLLGLGLIVAGLSWALVPEPTAPRIPAPRIPDAHPSGSATPTASSPTPGASRPDSRDPALQQTQLEGSAGPPTAEFVPPPPTPAPPIAEPFQPASPEVEPLPPLMLAPIGPESIPSAESPTEPADAGGQGDGPPIDLRVEEQDIRRALELLGSQASVNVLASPGVRGTISVNLQGVTFDEALSVLLRLGNLRARREGGIVYVTTPEEAEAIARQDRAPVIRVYHLNYARATDVAAIIRPFLSDDGTVSVTPPSQQGIGRSGGGGGGGGPGGGSAGGAGLMPPTGGGGSGPDTGSVISGGAPVEGDTGGNSLAIADTLIVRDVPESLAAIDQIVARLDVQPLQVLIEAVILSVNLTDDQALGVNFGLVDNLATQAAVAGSGALINAAAGFSPAQVLSATGAAPAPPGLPAFLGDRPGQLVSGYLADQGLKYGFVSNNVGGFIRALETFNKVNVLASPRLLVLNKQKAEIQLGRRLGFRNTVTNLTSSLQTVQFLSVGTLLSLRPFVSGDGMVRLEIHPERSSGGLDAQGIPQTDTSELTSNILIPDGATIVIGGLIDSEDSLGEEGVLGLSRLPLVGPLFRSRLTRANKRELIVLLTPRILRRDGLPPAIPGVAPAGPAGVPNSGPMPGPGAAPGPGGLIWLEHRNAPETFLGPAALRGGGGGEGRDPSARTSADPPAPTEPTAVPTAPGSLPGRHVVEAGEDLGTIAARYYGSASARSALWAVNRDRVPDPDRLRLGTTLLLLPPEDLRQVVDPAIATPETPGRPAPNPPPPSGGLRSLFNRVRRAAPEPGPR